MSGNALPIILSLVAAFFFAGAAAAQHTEASGVHESESLVSALLRSPRWWLGLVADTLGYGTQAAALTLGSVLLVQPLVVSSLLFALPLGALLARSRLPLATVGYALGLTLALAMFLIVGKPTAGADDAPFADWAGFGVVVIAVVVVGVLLGRWQRRSNTVRAMAFAVATAVLFAVTTVLTKPLITSLHGDTLTVIVDLLSNWRLYAMSACGLIAVYLRQRAFQIGALATALPAMMVIEPVVASLAGIAVLGESIHGTGWRGVLVYLAIAGMVFTTVQLARREIPSSGDHLPTHAV